MEWISVEDRLPEAKQNVLLRAKRYFQNRDEIVIAWREEDVLTEWYSLHFFEDEIVKATHWMPLPEPPKQ